MALALTNYPHIVALSDDLYSTEIIDSPPQSSPQPRLAPHPFDKPGADVVLRSCDLVDYRVRGHILLEASPVFESMLSLPQPQTINGDPDAPVVDLSEDSGTIELLLRICYPIKNPALDRPLDELETVLRGAMKYEMEFPVAVLTEHILSVAEHMPLRVWAVASRLHLEDVARHAAEKLRGVTALDFSSLGAMDGICAGDYYRLREFHRSGDILGGAQYTFLSPNSLRSARAVEAPCVWPIKPFPDDQPPNLVCRSSDGVDFGVHKEVLSAMSEEFFVLVRATMARDAAAEADERVAQTDAVPPTSLPVIHVGVRSSVLAPLLAFCYPRLEAFERISDLHVIGDLLVVADEYRMDVVSPVLEKLWTGEAELDPLRAYLVAATRDLHWHAWDAAKGTLDKSLDGVYLPELEDAPALTYHRLLNYHAACSAAATSVLTRTFPCNADESIPVSASTTTRAPDHRGPTSHGVGVGSICGHQHGGFRSSGAGWLSKYVSTLCLQSRLRPCGVAEDVGRVFTEATDAGLWCHSCLKFARDLCKIVQSIREIPSEVSKVTLEL